MPAVVPALAFVCGVGLIPAPGLAAALAAAAGATAALWVLRPRLRRGSAMALALALGLGLGGMAAAEGRRPLSGWIGGDGGAYEGHVDGRVLRAPERGEDGTWSFRASIRPDPDPSPGAPEAVVRFTVAASRSAAAAESVALLRAGDRVRLWARVRRPGRPGNPGQTDARAALAARGDHATGWVKSPLLVRPAQAAAPSPRLALDGALVRMRARLDRSLGPSSDARGLAGAMLLGDREGLGPDVQRVLRESGLAHLTAVSGLHVGIVVALVLIPLHTARRRPWGAAVVLGSAAVGFATLTGAAAPVCRAALMVLLALAGRLAGRSADPRNSLAVAAAALVAMHPPWAAHVGFRLSVGAVAGIVTLAPLLGGRPWAPRPVRTAVAMSAAVYAATAPVLAAEFHRLSPAGLWANPPAVGLGVGMVAGTLGTVAFGDVPILGPACAAVTVGVSRLLLFLAGIAADAPLGSVRVPAPGPWAWTILLVSWAVLTAAGRRRRGSRRAATAAFLVALASLHIGPPPADRAVPHVSVLDVGQGQSVVLWGPEGTCCVVDAAGSAGGRYDLGERLVVPILLDGGCRRVEVLALSHAHDDHAGGAPALLRGLEVGELWVPVGSVRDAGVRAALGAAVERGVAVRLAGRGTAAWASGWRLEGLHPSRDDLDSTLNDRGLALAVRSPSGARLMLAGDLEGEGEARVRRAGLATNAQALVAGHHGARNSNSRDWLAAVAPDLVVISAGEGNRFGHPHREALARFAAAAARVFRTDRDGQVRLFPGKESWRVETTVRPAGAAPE